MEHDFGPDGRRSRCARCGTLRDSYLAPCTPAASPARSAARAVEEYRLALPEGEAVISPGPGSRIVVEPVEVVGGTAQVSLRFAPPVNEPPDPGITRPDPVNTEAPIRRFARASLGVAIATVVPALVGAAAFELAGAGPVLAAGVGFVVATALLLVVFVRR